jgi:alcohol dehydrogenase class IV
MRWEFSTAHRVVFGEGAVREVGPAASEMGRRTLLVAGLAREAPFAAAARFEVRGEPSIDLVRRGVELARSEGCDVVVGFGGGSAIDTAKAVAAMLTNPGDPLDYLEVIGAGRKVARPAAPCIAVPTTAGTGAEVTRNAVLSSREHRFKASLRSPYLLPRLAVVDPELTLDLPPAVTASTGLDALTQLIEPYVSTRATPLTDLFTVDGMRCAATSLERAFLDGSDRAARADMCRASLLGGMSLANAGLGVVHGFAAPIGGMFDAPHGAICAALLSHGMEANLRALRERIPGSPALHRYETVARVLTGHAAAQPEDGVEWVRCLCARLRIPPLAAYGITSAHAAVLVEKARQASSMKANPVELTGNELTDMLTRALS